MITTSCYYCGITNILTWHFQLCWYTVKEVMIIAHCIELHQMVAYEWTVSVNNGEWCAACGVRILRVAMFGDEFTNCFALNLKTKSLLKTMSHSNFTWVRASLTALWIIPLWFWATISYGSMDLVLSMFTYNLYSSDLSLSYFRHCWWLWSVTVWAGQNVSKETSALATCT